MAAAGLQANEVTYNTVAGGRRRLGVWDWGFGTGGLGFGPMDVLGTPQLEVPSYFDHMLHRPRSHVTP